MELSELEAPIPRSGCCGARLVRHSIESMVNPDARWLEHPAYFCSRCGMPLYRRSLAQLGMEMKHSGTDRT